MWTVSSDTISEEQHNGINSQKGSPIFKTNMHVMTPYDEQHLTKHSAAMPKQDLDISAQELLPLRSSLKHNILKPAKKAAEAALCWFLDIEHNPLSTVPEESVPPTAQVFASQNNLGSATHAMGRALNVVQCGRFSRDNEAINELEVVHSSPSGHNHTYTTPCTGGAFVNCNRQPCVAVVENGDSKSIRAEANKRNLEELMENLFRIHDLNKNGVLEEAELIQLNKKIAVLHSGKDVDKAAVTEKYQNLFRSQFDPTGQPVSYHVFAKYMHQLLDDMEPRDVRAQIMIMEQFICEANVARKFFRIPSLESKLDAPFIRYISFDESITDMLKEDPEEVKKSSPDCKEITTQMHSGHQVN